MHFQISAVLDSTGILSHIVVLLGLDPDQISAPLLLKRLELLALGGINIENTLALLAPSSMWPHC